MPCLEDVVDIIRRAGMTWKSITGQGFLTVRAFPQELRKREHSEDNPDDWRMDFVRFRHLPRHSIS